jgi:hypothetical protein
MSKASKKQYKEKFDSEILPLMQPYFESIEKKLD